MAIQAGDLVEQLGTETVHHTHDNDQRGNPERDRDVSNHASTARLIIDNKNRWAMVPLNTSPRYIYTTLNTL